MKAVKLILEMFWYAYCYKNNKKKSASSVIFGLKINFEKSERKIGDI